MPQEGRTKIPGKSRPGYTSTESMRGGGGRPSASCGTLGPSTPWTWCEGKTSVTHTQKLENANIVNIVNKEFSKEMGKYKAFYEASQVSMSSANPAATNPTLTVNIFATVPTFFVMTMTSVSHTGMCAGGWPAAL